MTLKEFIDNSAKGFNTKEEGFSVKKMMYAVIILNLLALTWVKVTPTTYDVTLGIWLGFAAGSLTVSAVEKHIKTKADGIKE